MNAQEEERFTVDEHGRMCVVFYTEGDDGNPKRNVQPLANFTARIAEEIVLDDGSDAEPSFEFVIAGQLEDNGRLLPPIRVEAKSFRRLEWVEEKWGAEAAPRSGRAVRDEIREALQVLSAPIAKRRVYTHSGWHKIDGKWTYLHARGGIRADGAVADIVVELPDRLENFHLPDVPVDAPAATRVSLAILNVAPHEVTMPVLAATYLAPLASILRPNFLPHIVGETGSRKSTIAALAMQHFGAAFGTTTGAAVELPMHWMSTYASIEDAQFRLKDALFVLDDYKHQGDATLQKRLEAKAGEVIRAIGDRTGKTRTSWVGGGRGILALPPHPPRGLTLSTGEIAPPGHSDTGRLTQVPLGKDEVKLDELSKVQADSERLVHAMRAYVQWIAAQYDTLAVELPALHQKCTKELREVPIEHAHSRHPGALAYLEIGLEMFLRFAVAQGVLTEEGKKALQTKAREALLNLAAVQTKATRDADPAERFMLALRTLVVTERVRLRPMGTASSGMAADPNMPMIGWADDTNAYLIADEALRLVNLFFRDNGGTFPATKDAVLRGLVKLGYTKSRREGNEPYERVEVAKKCQGKKERVVVVALDKLIERDDPALKSDPLAGWTPHPHKPGYFYNAAGEVCLETRIRRAESLEPSNGLLDRAANGY